MKYILIACLLLSFSIQSNAQESNAQESNAQEIDRVQQLMAKHDRLKAGGVNSNNVELIFQLGFNTFRESCTFSDPINQQLGFNLSAVIMVDAGIWLSANAVKLHKGFGDAALLGGELVDSAEGMTAFAMTAFAGAKLAGEAVMAGTGAPAAQDRAIKKLASQFLPAVRKQIGIIGQLMKLYGWSDQNIEKAYQLGYGTLLSEWKQRR